MPRFFRRYRHGSRVWVFGPGRARMAAPSGLTPCEGSPEGTFEPTNPRPEYPPPAAHAELRPKKKPGHKVPVRSHRTMRVAAPAHPLGRDQCQPGRKEDFLKRQEPSFPMALYPLKLPCQTTDGNCHVATVLGEFLLSQNSFPNQRYCLCRCRYRAKYIFGI